jgi:hypothetical protein
VRDKDACYVYTCEEHVREEHVRDKDACYVCTLRLLVQQARPLRIVCKAHVIDSSRETAYKTASADANTHTS